MRFALESEGIARLAEVGSVVYRSFPHQLDESVTAAHIQRLGLPNVRIDPRTPLEPLIRRADLVVNVCSSGTTWNETMAIGVPQVVLCDSGYTPMKAGFCADFAAACRWCSTSEEFRQAIEEIAAGGASGALGPESARRHFLERYVVHRSDGRAAERLAEAVTRIASASPSP
jgi:hypothetical protein